MVTSTIKVPSAAVKRAATVAAQETASAAAAVPKTFAPWANVIQLAEQRFRGHIARALADLEHDLALAGAVLDTAEAAAKEASSQILEAAWKRWQQDIKVAADSAEVIMDPARKAYDGLVAKAGTNYDAAIAAARASYEAEVSRAESARALSAAMPSPAGQAAAG